MKNIILIAVVYAVFSVSAIAESQIQRYDSHFIFEQNLKAIDVRIISEFDTKHCGRKALFGEMRNISPTVGSQGEESDFLADFKIPSFLEVCPKDSPLRHIRLESEVFRIPAIKGRTFIISRILLPENMKLEVTRIE